MAARPAKSLRRQPKQARAQATVDVVLEAAARVLRDRGYARSTTNRIAEAAGVSIGTLYEYFPNKESVFDAVIERELDTLVGAFARQETRGGDLEANLRRIILAGMQAMPHGPELFRALEAVPDAAFRTRLTAARKRVIELITSLLYEHRAEVGVPDLERAAFVVVSAVEGVAANATSETLDPALADEMTALAVRYLRA